MIGDSPVAQMLADARLTPDEARELAFSFTAAEYESFLHDWHQWARPDQRLPAGDWATWLICSGRGWGKTKTGAETVREWSQDPRAVIALVGPTAADCRDVMVGFSETGAAASGIMKCFPPHERPVYKPSLRRLEFANGAVAFTYSAEEPERLRGPAHSKAWLDELASYDKVDDVWNNLQFGLRLGLDPRVIITTTPKSTQFLRSLFADSKTHITRGSTYANADFLPEATLAQFARVYAGTRIGRQELEGELLDEAEGALWTRANLESSRVRQAPDLVRIVVAIDPAVTATESSDETGIIAAGLGVDGHGYVLKDRSCRLPPAQWATRAVSCFDELDADKVLGESNNGGDLIEQVLRTVRPNLSYAKVTASRGKTARAEPVAALFEQGRVHLVGGFKELEDEMTSFVPGALSKSPNRADALVWAISYLMCRPKKQGQALWL